MANEYLKRTPTSTGNRKVFTFALWLKRNIVHGDTGADAVFNAADTSSNSHGTDIRFRKDNTGGNNFWNFYDYVSSAFVWVKYGGVQYRDSGNWFHAMFVFDSTKPRGDDRVKVYINGVLDTTIQNSAYDTNPLPNYDTFVNSLTEHYLGVDQYDGSLTTSHSKSQFSDVFLVDGQALTPDVFGFYKDGDGYVSAGSTDTATDFRPGQWVPKSPSVIKNVINNSGGFGVNGFYLPMNDSSNPGADFHCDPNSIITLKGEDLPQPRNGAPTTSDAYVSQLRSDSYAANLVLAVPGISTSTSATLVTNGTFDTDTTGWTLQSATGTLSVVSGELYVEYSSTNGTHCYQAITTEVGKRYTYVVTSRTTVVNQPAKFSVGTTINGSELTTRRDNNTTTNETFSGSFTATTTTTYITLGANFTADAYFDNVVVKQENVPLDYSADIKGSGTNKTLTAVGSAGIGYEIPGYYGSAMTFDNDGTNASGNTDVINVPTSSDFVFTGDVTMEGWIYPTGTPTTAGIIFGQWQSGGGTNRNFNINFNTSRQLIAYFNSSATNYNTGTSPVLALDQWHHVAAEKYGSVFTLYVNGVAVGVNTNTPTAGNTPTVPFTIGSETDGSNGADYGFNGQIQDVRVYKGVAKYKGGFDVPKPYTPVGIESWRTTTDTCSNNFATLNPLTQLDNNQITYSNGNLTAYVNPNTNSTISTLAMGSQKYYAEFIFADNAYPRLGVIDSTVASKGNNGSGTGTGANNLMADGVISWGGNSTEVFINSTTNSGTGTGYGTGDIIGVAYDGNTRNVWFSKNNVWQNFTGSGADPANGTNPVGTLGGSDVVHFAVRPEQSTVNSNFGQNPSFSGTITVGTNADDSGKGLFKYAPPTGFLALCEDNLPAPAIADPGEHFKTVLYEGDGISGHSVTGVGFKPDFVWMKDMDAANYNILVDSVRGPNKALFSNTPSAENLGVSIDSLKSFDNDGFSLSLDPTSASHSGWNRNTARMVAWCWKAGGAAVSNTDGTISSQVSVNQTAGFSIVTWTGNATEGATIGHGLGKAPGFIIVKNIYDGGSSGATNGNWQVWNQSFTGQQYINLNLTNELVTETGGVTPWGGTVPSSSVITLGSYNSTNGSSDSMIAYCWSEIEGYSKFGSYVGNASADGPFVYCGFKPAWVLIKKTNGSGNENWRLFDSSRCPTNQNNKQLLPSSTSIQLTETGMDFVSNGFKLRDGDAHQNQSGSTYIFMAFAESPFKTANAK